MGKRVSAPVQIATEKRPYAVHVRQYFHYEGYSYGQETKGFGELELSHATLGVFRTQ